MESLSQDWAALTMLVFLLGLRHGMDPDHLVTIDNLARFNSGSKISGWCGFLFSLGHGAVVSLVAIGVGLYAGKWITPSWLDDFGAWISILFLLLLGSLNLASVVTAPAGEMVRPVGIKGRWLSRFSRSSHPLAIVLVGALFALSFDTMTQAAVFSIAAKPLGGWVFSAGLGLTFMVGMMVTDGVNGLLVSRMLARADRRARIASRMMGLALAGSSFAVGALGILRYFSQRVADYSSGREFGFGMLFTAIVALCFIAALAFGRADSRA